MAKNANTTAAKKATAKIIHADGTDTKVPVEEIHQGPTDIKLSLPQVMTITAEQKAQQEVARFDVARSWIAGKKEEYKDLKINGKDDKEGRQKVKSAWQELKNKRIGVEKKHEEIKSDYLVITRAIDGEKKDLVILLKEVEIPLKEELDRDEKEAENERLELERKDQERLQARVAQLQANGMAFNGSYYAIGETISMDVVTLKGLTDEDYGKLLARVQIENKKIVDAKAEIERLAQQERDRLEQQRQQQEAQRLEFQKNERELQERREEFERQQKEFIKLRTKTRGAALELMGMLYNYSTAIWSFVTATDKIEVPCVNVAELNDQQWQAVMHMAETRIKSAIEKRAISDKERQEKEAAAEIERNRLAEEKKQKDAIKKNRTILLESKFKMVYAGNGYLRRSDFAGIADVFVSMEDIEGMGDGAWEALLKDVEGWIIDFEGDEKEQEGISKKLQESARQAALSEVQVIAEYLNRVNVALNICPTLQNKELGEAVDFFCGKVVLASDELKIKILNY